MRRWINIFLLYPWAIFVGIFIIEIFACQRIYLSAVLLAINLLIYRLSLFILKIVQKQCIESLDSINQNYFWGALGVKDKLPSFFIHSINIIAILDTHEKLDEEYLCQKWYHCYLGVALAGSFFKSHILKNYLVTEYRNLLNLITILLVVIVNLIFFKDVLPIFFQDGISYLAFIIIIFFSKFFLESKFLHINSFLHYFADFTRSLNIYRDLLQEQWLENNLKSMVLIIPVDDYFKPQNFLDGFSALDFAIIVPLEDSRIKKILKFLQIRLSSLKVCCKLIFSYLLKKY